MCDSCSIATSANFLALCSVRYGRRYFISTRNKLPVQDVEEKWHHHVSNSVLSAAKDDLSFRGQEYDCVRP